MIFNHQNTAPQTRVYDADTKQELTEVESINVETGEIVRFHKPLRIDADGEASRFRERYRSISPVYDGNPVLPVLFHCYGRIAA